MRNDLTISFNILTIFISNFLLSTFARAQEFGIGVIAILSLGGFLFCAIGHPFETDYFGSFLPVFDFHESLRRFYGMLFPQCGQNSILGYSRRCFSTAGVEKLSLSEYARLYYYASIMAAGSRVPMFVNM
jgi:hypothetical protein